MVRKKGGIQQPIIDFLSEYLINEKSEVEDTYMIDSMPHQIFRYVRYSKLKIMKVDLDYNFRNFVITTYQGWVRCAVVIFE